MNPMKRNILLLLMWGFTITLWAQSADKPATHQHSAACTHKKICTEPMPEAAFSTELPAVSGASTASLMMSAAKRLAIANCLTTGQIREIMLQFPDDQKRLIFAKFAYDNAWDPQNYLRVGEALTTTGSKEELGKFLESVKKP
jgi:hypothetical protein